MHIDRSSVRCTNTITPVVRQRKNLPPKGRFCAVQGGLQALGGRDRIDPWLPKNKLSFDLAPEHEIHRTIRDVDLPSWKTLKTRTANIYAVVRRFIDGKCAKGGRACEDCTLTPPPPGDRKAA